jgi:hypothetical protein
MGMFYAAVVFTLLALAALTYALYDVIHVIYLRWAINRETKKITKILRREGYIVFPDRSSDTRYTKVVR